MLRAPAEQYNGSAGATAAAPPKKMYIQLPLDHENPALGQFLNKYYIDTTMWDGAGPCFFFMGQEAPTGGVGGGYIGELAARYKAMVVAIEVRIVAMDAGNMTYAHSDSHTRHSHNGIRSHRACVSCVLCR